MKGDICNRDREIDGHCGTLHKDTESTTEGGQARTIASRPIRFGYCEDC